MRTVLSCALAALLGLAVSFLTAGPALFSDGPFAERLWVLVISVVLFALLGGAIAFVSPDSWKPVAITLMVVSVPIVALFGPDTLGQLPMMLLAVGFVLGDSAAGASGALMGARVRSAWRSHVH